MVDSSGAPWHRRPVLQVLGAGVVGGIGAVAGGAGSPAGADGSSAGPGTGEAQARLTLIRHRDGRDETRLQAEDFEPRGTGRWRSPVLEIPATALVAVTWPGGADTPTVRLRTRRHGTWRPWQTLHELLDKPDPDTDEGLRSRGGTQPMWLSGVQHVQLLTHGDQPPSEISLVAIGTRTRPADRVVAPPAVPDERRVPGVPPRPSILTREQWGADPKWRSGAPRYCTTIQQVHVHHTDTGNDYTKDDVPSILRAIYRYHTKSLGWSDIGYNFLVDKFGRLWEGRAGGIDRPVLGAHTLGFNATSAGISMIGTYSDQEPSASAITSVVELASWKLGLYGRRATATATVTSQGSDRYGPGQRVVLPVIDGHRDTNHTECPGTKLYQHLPGIRTRAQQRLDSAGQNPGTVVVSHAFSLTGNPTPGHRLTVVPGTVSPSDATVGYAWYRGTTPVTTVKGAGYPLTSADIGQVVAVVVTVSKSGYAPVTETLPMPVPVKAPSHVELTVTHSGTQTALVATVTTAAESASTPTGNVVFRLGSAVQTVALAGGTARATFTDAATTAAAASADYTGNDRVMEGCTTTVRPVV